jgi:hypothetical protein
MRLIEVSCAHSQAQINTAQRMWDFHWGLMVERQAKVFLSAQNNELIVNYKYLCQFSCKNYDFNIF